jgi:type II secretory pathway component PulF
MSVNLLQPLVILLMAGLVLFVAVACLSPFFNLIHGLSG